MSSSSSTAVNPPTPHLSSLTSSTPSSSDFVFVGQPTSNTMTNAQIVPVSLDQVQMSLSSLGQGLSLEEALMRVGDLMKENADLKAVLQLNNQAMREQCQVLMSVKHQWVAERDEMKHKFDQTRSVMIDLRTTIQERDERIGDLEGQLEQTSVAKEDSPSTSVSAEMNSLKQRREDAEKLAELHSAQNKFLQKQTDKLNDRIEQLTDKKAKIEAENVRLVQENESIKKDCDEIREALMKQTELNEHLKVEKTEVVALNSQLSEQVHHLQLLSRDSLVNSSQPTSDVPLNKECSVVVKSSNPAVQEGASDLEARKLEEAQQTIRLEQSKYEELQARYTETSTLIESLRQQISNKDQHLVATNEKLTAAIDSLNKQHEEDIGQLRKQLEAQPQFETTTLQAQVMTLLQEVKETETRLTAALLSAETYKQSCHDLQTRVTSYEREKTQHSLDGQLVEALHSQIASLEANLILERKENQTKSETLQELRASFDQLCNDYHELLSSSEEAKGLMKHTTCQTSAPGEMLTEQLKSELIEKVDNLTAQLFTAKDALARYEDELRELKSKLKKLEEEDITVLKAQAEVYKVDFDAERAAREQQQHEKLQLLDDMRQCQTHNKQLERQIALLVMQLRHPPPGASSGGWRNGSDTSEPEGRRPSASMALDQELEPMEPLRCPVCQVQFPDEDSLQFHVTECLS